MRAGGRRAGAWIAAAAFLMWAAPAGADLGGFRIARFDTELRIDPNSDLLVTETIAVDFSEARHGLYREIPIRYTDPTGYVWSVGFRLLDVGDAGGGSHPFKVTQQRQSIRIRIGDPDRTVRGRVTYVIRYQVKGALRAFADHDELYWNATGHEWRTTIESATAIVHLPAELAADSVIAVAYVGALGSREGATEIAYEPPRAVHYVVERALGPHEGLTVVASWPRGHVRFPSRAARLAGFLGDNWILLAPIAALVLLARRYRRGGRDPDAGSPVMVRYEPPSGVTPGGVGAIVDEQVDLRDVTATIVDLAVRGYVSIRVEERPRFLRLGSSDEIVLERRREAAVDELQEHERLLLDGLFAGGTRVEMSDLRERFYSKLPGIHRALYDRMVRDGYFWGNPQRVRQRWVGLGFLAALATAAGGAAWAVVRGAVFPNAMAVPIASALATLAAFGAFSRAMPRRTAAGSRLRAWALGFEEFIDRVEADRMQREEARGVFEKLLPYAMALGVSSQWARRFEGIYATAGPTWYAGTHPPGVFSTRGFEQSLSSSMSQAGRTLVSSPRSSGSSGGGGFSGGGSGGGGGGSW
jgi:hypothetical protein